jgi:hypothetical protein
MRMSPRRLALAVSLVVFCPPVLSPAEKSPDPKILSLYPLGGRPGEAFTAHVRGKGLAGAARVWVDSDHITAHIRQVAPIQLPAEKYSGAKSDRQQDGQRVALQVKVGTHAEPGAYRLRLISDRGISNPVTFLVGAEPVVVENEGEHQLSKNAQLVSVPVAIQGRISQEGETDWYEFEAGESEDLMFEVVCNPSTDGVLASKDKDCDPRITLYEPTGSWFSPETLTRLAVNDDAIWQTFSKSALLAYRFPRDGRYLAKIDGHRGAGGPDEVYQFRIFRSSRPEPIDGAKLVKSSPWRERDFRRGLEPDRMARLQARTAAGSPPKPAAPKIPAGQAGVIEKGPATDSVQTRLEDQTIGVSEEVEPNDDPAGAVEISIPGIVEGAIQRPGDVDVYTLSIDRGRKLAFEIELTDTRLPHFSPYLEVLTEAGDRVLTNLHKRVVRNSTFYQKDVQPKSIHAFETEGEHIIRVRDLTSRLGSAGFKYRLLVRPQVPHIGELHITEKQLNIVRGEAKKLNITTDQEEGYQGEVAVVVEGLPEGVSSLPGTEVKPEGGPPLDEGEKEKFVPPSQTATIILAADESAPLSVEPRFIRVVARPVVGGKLGKPLRVGELPLMVVDKPRMAAEAAPAASPGLE